MATIVSAATLAKLRSKVAGIPAPKARSKYGNKKVAGFDLDGTQVWFDSGREAKRWGELLLRLKAGEIADLQRQIRFTFRCGSADVRYKARKKLGRQVTYVADFVYVVRRTGDKVVEDAKGMKTDAYKIKWALMKAYHGIEVQEV